MTSPEPAVVAPPSTAHSGATVSSSAKPENPAHVMTISGAIPGSRQIGPRALTAGV